MNMAEISYQHEQEINNKDATLAQSPCLPPPHHAAINLHLEINLTLDNKRSATYNLGL